jgi:hypothetical protein
MNDKLCQFNIGSFVISNILFLYVMLVKRGIQLFQIVLDIGFRRYDNFTEF